MNEVILDSFSHTINQFLFFIFVLGLIIGAVAGVLFFDKEIKSCEINEDSAIQKVLISDEYIQIECNRGFEYCFYKKGA